MRSLLTSTDLRVGYIPAVTVYHVHGHCYSGALLSVVVLMVLSQGEMKLTTLDVGMRCKRRGGELCSS